MLERRQLGHYHLVQRIGGGGMGEIYLAQDARIERQVALKIVRAEVDPYPDAAATADVQRLFLREMQAISRLDHPHILPLYDFGEERMGNTILAYMVMPYRPEGSLSDWLQRRVSVEKLSFQDVAHFVTQAAEALQHAHDRALVHQDVKPSNFLVRNRSGFALPDLLLSDFGIARVLSSTAIATQSVRGTPAAMAPEQWQGNPEPATDQYALAIMAYVLLVGHPPFSGRMEQLMLQHLSVQPQPPGAHNPAIPGDLDSVILTALAKQPRERFGSMTAFARAFQQAASAPGFANPFTVNAPPAPQLSSAQPGSLSDQGAPPLAAPSLAGHAGPEMPRPMPPPVTPYPLPLNPSLLPATTPDSLVQQKSGPAPLVPMVAPGPQPSFPQVQQQRVVLANAQTYSPAGYPLSPYTTPPPLQTPGAVSRSRSLRLLIAACLAAVLVVSGIIGVGVYQDHVASVNANATANAQATTNAQGTASRQAALNIQATSTAIASQATADAQATVNAQASATAQVGANNPYPSYMSGSGTLVLIDSLQTPTNWQADSDPNFGGTCQFTDGAFHVAQVQPRRFYNCQDSTSFGNFALEVQLTILQGDCGGATIRTAGNQFYYLKICADGSYSLWKYASNTDGTRLVGGNSAAIHTGVNTSNTLGIVANEASIELYVNQQRVDSVDDDSYSSGYISLCAEDTTNATEVAFSNIRIWA